MALAAVKSAPEKLRALVPQISPAAFEHSLAFALCIERADHDMRSRLGATEVGHVIAEDVTHMRDKLTKATFTFRNAERLLPPEHQNPSIVDDALGLAPTKKHQTIARIRHQPQFLRQADAPLLALSDACAFTFRRWISGYNHSEELMTAMLGAFHAGKLMQGTAWKQSPSSASLIDHAAYDIWERNTRRSARHPFLHQTAATVAPGAGA
ncbi:hypothetical protein [Phaeovulum vinaykumarii]|uniref:hypothetical protein n=1 Tax=Phaeovulum vinaykumarii TaxID=407234 RepID=UPI00117A6012|nr:hypothetical protein [Phaeovulum vinaykumarii]